MAAQLIATKSPVRPEHSWISRDKTSLPVPLSPRKSTVMSAAAERRARLSTCFIEESCATTSELHACDERVYRRAQSSRLYGAKS